MSEIQIQPEQLHLLNAENLPLLGYKLGPNEQVIITSTFSDRHTFPIRDPITNQPYPVPYASVVGIRLGDVDSGDEQKYDEFEVMFLPEGETYLVRAMNHNRSGSMPEPLFSIGNGSGIIGKAGKPFRDKELAAVSREHIRISSEGNQLRVENRNPQYNTVLFRIQSAEQTNYSNLTS